MHVRMFAALFALAMGCHGAAAQSKLDIYVDADFSVSYEAAQAIELGVRAALDGAGGRLGGLPVDISARDHHGNAKRSRQTMQAYLDSPNAIAIFGGLHSMPYLTYREFINGNGILLLAPWSAAGPITRAQEGDVNWTFRLSVDDSKAGTYLVDQAMTRGGCANVALLLSDSGWGRTNQKTMTAALSLLGAEPAFIAMVSETVGPAHANAIAGKVAASGADCAIMLANAVEGGHVVNALHRRATGVRVFSHWGILGRDFSRMAPHAIRETVRLRVLQTCGLKIAAQRPGPIGVALAAVRAGGREAASLSDIYASPGFVHGHDLTLLLIEAAKAAALTPAWAGDITAKRAAIRDALERLDAPVAGILKDYLRPFGPYSAGRPDAHEALGAEDLCMTAFTSDDRLATAPAGGD
ncbi:MAG: branched-chain amino acid transport system substrate-binding protein [Paracoccaceae bacterium]|jgi:branched-chain amino acid transport system substrate-binding protein